MQHVRCIIKIRVFKCSLDLQSLKIQCYLFYSISQKMFFLYKKCKQPMQFSTSKGSEGKINLNLCSSEPYAQYRVVHVHVGPNLVERDSTTQAQLSVYSTISNVLQIGVKECVPRPPFLFTEMYTMNLPYKLKSIVGGYFRYIYKDLESAFNFLLYLTFLCSISSSLHI